MRKIILSILMLLFCTVAAQAALAGEKVKEPETGIKFDKELPGGWVLVGVGVREKFSFDIYAAALYVKRGPGLKTLLAARDPYAVLISGAAPRRLVMHFVRKVPGHKAAKTFRENLNTVMSGAERKKCADDIKRYFDSFSKDIKKGEQVLIESTDKLVDVTMGGRKAFQSKNPVFISNMWEIYFGSKPLSQSLKTGLVSLLPKLK